MHFFLVITKKWPAIAYMRLMACRELTHVLCVLSLERLLHQKNENVDFYLVYSMDSVSLDKQRMQFLSPLPYTI